MNFVIVNPDGSLEFTIAILAGPLMNCILAGVTGIAGIFLIWYFRRWIFLLLVFLVRKG